MTTEIRLRAMEMAVQAGTAGEPPPVLIARAEQIETFLAGRSPARQRAIDAAKAVADYLTER